MLRYTTDNSQVQVLLPKAKVTWTSLDTLRSALNQMKENEYSKVELFMTGFDMQEKGFRKLTNMLEESGVFFDEISLFNNKLRFVSTEHIAILFSITKRLDLSSNFIGPRSSIPYGLRGNTSLVSLDLSRNEKMDIRAFAAIVESLQGNTTLKRLNLHRHAIDLNEFTRSFSFPFDLNAIETLDLSLYRPGSRNTYDDVVHDASAVVEMLKSTSLTSLNLSDNYIGQEEATDILNAASTNTTLINLDVSYNSSHRSSFVALEHFLETNSTLKTLKFSNDVPDEHVLPLLDAISVNTSLTALKLKSEDERLKRAVTDISTRNASLFDLLLSHTGMGPYKRPRTN